MKWILLLATVMAIDEHESAHLGSITTYLPLARVDGAIRPTKRARLWIIWSWSTRSSRRTGNSKQESKTGPSEAKNKKICTVPFMCDSPDFVIRHQSKRFFFEPEKKFDKYVQQISISLPRQKLFCLVSGRRFFNCSWVAEISSDKSRILLVSK